MSALNLPSAADLERLTRRLRSVSQRLEGIEDGVDRLDRRLEETARAAMPPDDRLAAIEAQLSKLAGEVAHLASGAGSNARADPARAGAARGRRAGHRQARGERSRARPGEPRRRPARGRRCRHSSAKRAASVVARAA